MSTTRLNFQRLDDGTWGVKSQGFHHPLPGDTVSVPKRNGGESRVRLGAQVQSWNGGRARVFRIAKSGNERPVPARPRSRPATSGPRTIQARYRGTCADCGGGFEKGDTIRWAKGYTAHVVCPDEAEDAEAHLANLEYAEAERERRHMDAEYAKGVSMAQHIRDARMIGGEAYAAAEELAWELRDPSY